jgi:sec-independent protein translocase protein TatA
MFRNPLSDALVVLVILLLFFGPKRLPMLSRSIGESIREFKGGITKSSEDEEDDKPQLTAASGETSPVSEPAQAGAEAPRETAPVSAERDS